MVIETLVLDRDKSVLQILGDLIYGFINTVGSGSHQFFDLCGAVIRIDGGSVPLWFYIIGGYFRGVLDDPQGKYTDACGSGHCDHDKA